VLVRKKTKGEWKMELFEVVEVAVDEIEKPCLCTSF